jgi:anti-sigma-K factor RskA/cell division protein FtsB
MSVDQYISSGILELYAAHALPEEEMREVESMAEKHETIRDELEAISEALKKYAAIYAPAKLSEALYNKIQAKIDKLEVVDEAIPHIIEAPVLPVKVEKKPEKVVKLQERSEKSGSGRFLLLIAASILLLLSVGVNVYLYQKYNSSQDQILALQSENNAMAENSRSLKTNYDKVGEQLKLYTDPQNKMIMLKGMPISPASEVMVIWNGSTKDVFVEVHRLPAPPEGMQYQLWAIDKDGNPIDAGMLTPYKEQVTHGPQPMKKVTDAVSFAVTLEKRGGSPTPTIDKIYAKGEV